MELADVEMSSGMLSKSSILTEDASVNTAAAVSMGLAAVEVMVEELDETAPWAWPATMICESSQLDQDQPSLHEFQSDSYPGHPL